MNNARNNVYYATTEIKMIEDLCLEPGITQRMFDIFLIDYAANQLKKEFILFKRAIIKELDRIDDIQEWDCYLPYLPDVINTDANSEEAHLYYSYFIPTEKLYQEGIRVIHKYFYYRDTLTYLESVIYQYLGIIRKDPCCYPHPKEDILHVLSVCEKRIKGYKGGKFQKPLNT